MKISKPTAHNGFVVLRRGREAIAAMVSPGEECLWTINGRRPPERGGFAAGLWRYDAMHIPGLVAGMDDAAALPSPLADPPYYALPPDDVLCTLDPPAPRLSYLDWRHMRARSCAMTSGVRPLWLALRRVLFAVFAPEERALETHLHWSRGAANAPWVAPLIAECNALGAALPQSPLLRHCVRSALQAADTRSTEAARRKAWQNGGDVVSSLSMHELWLRFRCARTLQSLDYSVWRTGIDDIVPWILAVSGIGYTTEAGMAETAPYWQAHLFRDGTTTDAARAAHLAQCGLAFERYRHTARDYLHARYPWLTEAVGITRAASTRGKAVGEAMTVRYTITGYDYEGSVDPFARFLFAHEPLLCAIIPLGTTPTNAHFGEFLDAMGAALGHMPPSRTAADA